MPATKLDAVRRNRAELVRIIRRYCFGIGSVKDAAPLVGMSYGTLYNRLANPGQITIDELRRLINGLHIPPDEILPYIV